LVHKEPVNSFDTALWAALGGTLRKLEADSSVRGVVFASGLKREVFTAGNDLKELYAPNTSADRCATSTAALGVRRVPCAGGPPSGLTNAAPAPLEPSSRPWVGTCPHLP
jgi:hypothetical protein